MSLKPVRGQHPTDAESVPRTKASPTAASIPPANTINRKTPSPTTHRMSTGVLPPAPPSRAAHSRTGSGELQLASPSGLSSAYPKSGTSKSASPIDLLQQERLNARHSELLNITSPANPLMDAGDGEPATSPPNVGLAAIPLGKVHSPPTPLDEEALLDPLVAQLRELSERSGTRVEDLLAGLAVALQCKAMPSPIALRQAAPSAHSSRPDMASPTGKPNQSSNQDDGYSGHSDSSSLSDAGSDADDSDAYQHYDEQEHEHYREMRRHQCTPLGAGPQVLSKFHVGVKTPEAASRRVRELDREVSTLAARVVDGFDRDAAVTAALVSPSPNTYRILQGGLHAPNEKMFESAEMLSRSLRSTGSGRGEDYLSVSVSVAALSSKAAPSPRRRTPTAGSPPMKPRGSTTKPTGSLPLAAATVPNLKAKTVAAGGAGALKSPTVLSPRMSTASSYKPVSKPSLVSKPRSSKVSRSGKSDGRKSKARLSTPGVASPPSHIAYGPPPGVHVPLLKLSPRFSAQPEGGDCSPNVSRAVDLNSPRSSAFSKASSLHSGSPRSACPGDL